MRFPINYRRTVCAVIACGSLLFASMALRAAADHSVPDWTFTPGALCQQGQAGFQGFYYPEHIPICRQNVTLQMRREVALHYGVPEKDWGKFEFTFLIPPAIGGASSIDNIWLRPKGDNASDDLDRQLVEQMRTGKITQAQAVKRIRDFFIKTPTPANARATSNSSPSTTPAAAGAGHWERGAPAIVWPYGPPTDAKSGRKMADPPRAGESWVTGSNYKNTIESMGQNQYSNSSVSVVDPKGFNFHDSGSWTLPPASLTPGQKFTMQITAGASGGASCYAWQPVRRLHSCET